MGGLKMKLVFFLLLVASSVVCAQAADERIYRCGNEYTNAVTEAQAKNCKLISGGNVTVIQAVKAPPRLAASGQRTDSTEQRAKESDARLILDSELKKAEAKLAELRTEYNDGAPERLGPETRNHQKYVDRVEALKTAISRSENDIAGIKRELSRLGPASASASSGK
jgi:hypothetical protein